MRIKRGLRNNTESAVDRTESGGNKEINQTGTEVINGKISGKIAKNVRKKKFSPVQKKISFPPCHRGPWTK